MDTHEARLLALANHLRAEYGVLALRPSLALMQAAQAHADEMAAHNYMGHVGIGGSRAGDRIIAAGYPRSTWGENVAGGYQDADATFAQWRNSSGHFQNMINSSFTEMGIARARGSRWGWVWCQTFGGADTPRARPCGVEPPAPPPVAPPSLPNDPPPSPAPPPPDRAERTAQRKADRKQERLIDRVMRRLRLR